MGERHFGEIDGIAEGTRFSSRDDLFRANVHRQLQGGICGGQHEGAESIVVSGGYEDDEDHGDVIIYTGQGGRDLNTGVQIRDQSLTRGNQALAYSYMNGLPVRVIRGAHKGSMYAPLTGYRYDGVYRVEKYWHESGRAGYLVYRYRLLKLSTSPDVLEVHPSNKNVHELPAAYAPAERRETTVLRVVRDTSIARMVKVIHDYQCQVCGIQLRGPAGPYAESAHIQPLGRPHDGPDTLDNLLCLCANHHVLFDCGAFSINDDGSFVGIEGQLRFHPDHRINSHYLTYHRNHFYQPISINQIDDMLV